MLRSLSHVSQRLRQFVLPVLWEEVIIRSIRRLGILQELLRVSPSIAQLIKSFRFVWNLEEGYHRYQGTGLWTEQGTILELVFKDRLQLWHKLRERHGGAVEINTGADERATTVYFEHGNQKYYTPGKPSQIQAARGAFGQPVYDWSTPLQGGKGPDGDGEDERVKDPQELQGCITEIVERLPLLEVFDWSTGIMPMPRGVFNALSKLESLTSLAVQVESQWERCLIHNCECDSSRCSESAARRAPVSSDTSSLARSAVLEHLAEADES